MFAINTISMVKNDALFSYIAPGNIFAWAFMPLRYCMPMKQFVWLNRFVIKVTHLPLLFCIYIYERFVLAPSIYDPTDLVENPGRGRHRSISFADPASRTALFSPNVRVREESTVGYQKDRALEEVFRRAPDYSTFRTQRRNERRKTQNAIRSWMDQHEGGYTNSPNNHATLDSRARPEWSRRLSMRDLPVRFRHFSDVKSAASDPVDLFSNPPFPLGPDLLGDRISRQDHSREAKDNTDADGDDELVTNDEDEEDNITNPLENQSRQAAGADEEDYFTTPTGTRFTNAELETGASTVHASPQQKTPLAGPSSSRRNPMHSRTLSTTTILYAPQTAQRPGSSSSASVGPSSHPRSRPLSGRPTPIGTPVAPTTGRRSPRRSIYLASRPHPIVAPREMARTAPNRPAVLGLDIPGRKGPPRRQDSIDLDASSELIAALAADDTLGAVPSSFATQMALATGLLTPLGKSQDNARMNRLMLAKMKTLEESLGDVVREMRVLRSTVPSTAQNSGDDGSLKNLPRRFDPGSLSGGSAGPPVIEVARGSRMATKRTKSAPRPLEQRPGSRRSMTEDKADEDEPETPPIRPRSKGKGKAPLLPPPSAQSDEVGYGGDDGSSDELPPAERSFRRRGSSF